MLLQQILRTMEDPKAPRRDAAIFAMLALVVRLIATQSGVFDLWYSRRCYERSRGEMVTMIFEKTLARKIIGAPKRPQPEECAHEDATGSLQSTKRSNIHPYVLWSKVHEQLRNMFASRPRTKDVKEPASMGKVLNLMR